MFKRAVNFLRTAPRYLLLAGLALVLGFLILGVDAVLNPPEPIEIAHNGRWLVIDQVWNLGADWTFPCGSGEYGLMDFRHSQTKTYATVIEIGSAHYELGFSLYTVVGAGNCFLFAGVILLAGLARRKRK